MVLGAVTVSSTDDRPSQLHESTCSPCPSPHAEGKLHKQAGYVEDPASMLPHKESECAYTMLVVAIYWLTEAMPLSVTALLPALMFPLFGIMQSTEVASTYFKDFHLLLIGVICLATSIEKWNLHKRIALRMVILMGVNPGRLMMGFMLSCSFLSMWLSNTSTAAMAMPVVEAVLQQIMNAEAVTDIPRNTLNGVTNQALELNEEESEIKKLESKEKIELDPKKQGIIQAKENEAMKWETKELDGPWVAAWRPVKFCEERAASTRDVEKGSHILPVVEGPRLHAPSELHTEFQGENLVGRNKIFRLGVGLQPFKNGVMVLDVIARDVEATRLRFRGRPFRPLYLNELPRKISWGHRVAADCGHATVFIGRAASKEEVVRKYRNEKDHDLCKGICLCIAYSSTIGGLTTTTGTSTNLIFVEQFNTRYPDCHCINFGSWFVLVFPMTVIILLLSWLWLHVIYFGFSFSDTFQFGKEKDSREKASIKMIEEDYKKLGPMGYQEIVTLTVFCLMALLWFTRDPGFFPGWSFLFPQYKGFATDSTVALLLGLLFFILPADKPTSAIKKKVKGYTTLITWKEFQSCMPWEISLLVGGGFALAKGSEVSGLSLWMGSKLEPLGTLPAWVIVLVACLIVTSVTEVASNPATITIFLPILAPLAEAIHVNPLYLLIPSTLCTSFAFLLPVSNPPNAIVYGYGHLTVMDMVKAGLGVNIIGILVVMIAMSTWAIPLYDLKTYPSWAQDLGNATFP
ncbi:solute carrier family 13 member 1-like [Heterodontus francisci]|uniref:solute carrier family 13 member 1-like n=1 Tax=Heterodontus francisci TaxID=7792 RepID=UPI00355B7A94